MKWILFALLGLGVIVAIMAIVGARLPREHRATRTVRLPRPPAEVFPVISRVAKASRVPVDVLESSPPHRLVTRVSESEKQFGGTWTITIDPADRGSSVTITEDGWVASPVFRVISHYIIGDYATMDSLLKNVAREIG